ncbi:MAG: S-adenosylmethionine-dependent methyltransferase [Cirrosporium novae-zelandiae]|nr:MAG: S-adenosylmethionine-dependent methyltransferase [Cirrosporium novae-zelandiae]
MLPTPSTSHLSPYNTVYEPAEDTFLVLDTLSSPPETSFLQSRFISTPRTPLTLEIGTGTGILSAFLTANAKTILGRQDVVVLATDVNIHACRGARETVRKAVEENIGIAGGEKGSEKTTTTAPKSLRTYSFTPILCSLIPPLLPRTLDILIYNPPYVPTDELPDPPPLSSQDTLTFNMESTLLALTYAGGPDGMHHTFPVLDALPEIMSPLGVAYFIFCKRNLSEEVGRAWLAKRNQEGEEGTWGFETVARSGGRAGFELLEVVRIWRKLGTEKENMR